MLNHSKGMGTDGRGDIHRDDVSEYFWGLGLQVRDTCPSTAGERWARELCHMRPKLAVDRDHMPVELAFHFG